MNECPFYLFSFFLFSFLCVCPHLGSFGLDRDEVHHGRAIGWFTESEEKED